jgi:hypothetical protein
MIYYSFQTKLCNLHVGQVIFSLKHYSYDSFAQLLSIFHENISETVINYDAIDRIRCSMPLVQNAGEYLSKPILSRMTNVWVT